jgi:alpha-1,2-mannosyltransferase
MNLKVFLCASEFPDREKTINRVGIDVSDSIDGFVRSIRRDERPPLLGIYQRLVYSYFYSKKLIKEFNPDFIVSTGGSALIPASAAEKTIVYVHYPFDLEVGVTPSSYKNSLLKNLYTKPATFISFNLDDIKKATIIANSNFTKKEIRKIWNIGCTVVYPPCPQYDFPLSQKVITDGKNKGNGNDTICCLGRFTPEKEYDTILEIARKMPYKLFELIGSVTPEKMYYLDHLKKAAPNNVIFHVNASIEEKIDVLRRGRAFLHAFKDEHFGIAIVEAMSAGLVPVTHNSGAAKDDKLVADRFRYDDVDQAVSCLEDAVSSWTLDTAEKLRDNAFQFSSAAFRENFKNFVASWLDSR